MEQMLFFFIYLFFFFLEIKQVNRNLESIREELWRTTSGGAGKGGFAEVVYNFVDMEAGRCQYENDCFLCLASRHFVAFGVLRKSQGQAAAIDVYGRVGLSRPVCVLR